ncbi:MAG: TPM domain-containing protein, partial [Bacteroidota bacterium]
MLRRLILLLLHALPLLVAAEDFPPRSTTLVTDFAGVLAAEQRQALEAKLVSFDDSTSTQVSIVLMTSIGSYEIADYAVQLYNKWGIGRKGKDNGVLILVAVKDKKVFINTGYGIEGALPDALCKRIVERDIVPHFKAGDYYGGLDAATTSIIGLVKGEFSADGYRTKNSKKGSPLFFVLIALIIFVLVAVSSARRTRRYAQTNNLSFWAAWALLNAAANRSRGSWNHFSGGGGWSGGGGGFG